MRIKPVFGFLVICLCLFFVHSISAQNFSLKYNQEYPIAPDIFSAAGYPKAPLAKELFQNINLEDISKNGHTGKTLLESSTIDEWGAFNAILLYVLDGKNVFRLQMRIQTDDVAKRNYITFFRLVQLDKGQSIESLYDGTVQSHAKNIGLFTQYMKVFYKETFIRYLQGK